MQWLPSEAILQFHLYVLDAVYVKASPAERDGYDAAQWHGSCGGGVPMLELLASLPPVAFALVALGGASAFVATVFSLAALFGARGA